MIHLKMKNIMKSRKTTDSTRRKGRDAQADPDEDYLDQDYLERLADEIYASIFEKNGQEKETDL